MSTRILPAALLAVFSACADGEALKPVGQPNPTVETIKVSMEPQDLTTNIGGGAIEVVLWRNGPAMDEEAVEAAAATLKLIQNASERPATIEVLPPPAPNTFFGVRRSIRITPQTEVSGWFEVRITPPAGAEGYAPAVSRVPGTGEVRARLNAVSAPVVREVQLCQNGSGLKASVGFSESVALRTSGADALTVYVAGSACVPSGTGAGGPEAGDATERIETARLACTGVLESDVEVRLSTLTSVDGVAVSFPGQDSDVRELTLRGPDATTPEASCRRWSF